MLKDIISNLAQERPKSHKFSEKHDQVTNRCSRASNTACLQVISTPRTWNIAATKCTVSELGWDFSMLVIITPQKLILFLKNDID